MKNAHIKPGQLVPAELRLEIYKEAKRSIENNTNLCEDVQMLCVCILWDLKDYTDESPLGERWTVNHSEIMFPEFGKGVNAGLDNKRKQQALDELTKAIEKLEAELAPKRNGVEVIKTNIATRVNDNLNELPFDAALDCFVQIRENMRERRAAEIAALEQPKNERLIYLKNIEL